MKKVAAALSTLGFLANSAIVFAQVNVTPGRPAQGINPTTEPSTIITNALTIVFVAAILLVLVFILMGAFQWITSGGDKDKVAGARKTIVNALIGLAILALAFFIARVAGSIVGINFSNLVLPRLDQPTTVTPLP
jgi:hypothetical protein